MPACSLYVLLAPRLGATGGGQCRRRGTLPRPARAVGGAGPVRPRPRRRRRAPGATPSAAASAGYVGVSDGWQDFATNGALTWQYNQRRAGQRRADRRGCPPPACWRSASATAPAGGGNPRGLQPDPAVRRGPAAPDRRLAGVARAAPTSATRSGAMRRNRCADQFMVSTMVLRGHLDKTYPGAMVASLSVPWGDSGNERGGYHLVWPRDLVQCAGALLALGAEHEARNTLRYLIATQTRRRALGPEPVARRAALLAGHAARPDRLPGAARCPAGRTQRPGRHRGRRHGAPRARLSAAPPGRRATRTGGRKTPASTPIPLPPASPRWSPGAPFLPLRSRWSRSRSRISGTPDRDVAGRPRRPAGRAGRHSRLLHPPGTRRHPDRSGRARCVDPAAQPARAAQHPGRRTDRRSTSSISCGSACAAPTIRWSWTACASPMRS